MAHTFGFKLDENTARRLRLATGGRGQSAALRAAMASVAATGVVPAGPDDGGTLTSSDIRPVTITLRVSDELAAAWTRAIGTQKKSDALRRVALSVADRPRSAKPPGSFEPTPLPHVAPVPRSERATLTLHLADGLSAELARVADELGVTPARWAAAWLTVRLSGTPLFTGHDAQAIRQVANELAAIGRNINAIARAMNVEAEQSRRRDHAIAEVTTMAAEVLAFRKEVRQLTSQQLAYWTDEHG